jgi:hypothetical protein
MQNLIRVRLVKSLSPTDITNPIELELLAIPRVGEVVMPNLSSTATKYTVRQVVHAARHNAIPAEIVLIAEEQKPMGSAVRRDAEPNERF